MHPAYVTYRGWERDETIENLVKLHCAKRDDDSFACNRQKAQQVLRRDWPDVVQQYRRSQDEYDGLGYLEMQGMTVDQFLGRSE